MEDIPLVLTNNTNKQINTASFDPLLNTSSSPPAIIPVSPSTSTTTTTLSSSNVNVRPVSLALANTTGNNRKSSLSEVNWTAGAGPASDILAVGGTHSNTNSTITTAATEASLLSPATGYSTGNRVNKSKSSSRSRRIYSRIPGSLLVGSNTYKQLATDEDQDDLDSSDEDNLVDPFDAVYNVHNP